MKSESRSVALIALLALGMVGCGGGSGSSSNTAGGSGGTVPMPTGPTGGDLTPSTLQTQLAACPNDLVIGKDVPCFVGTYEGVTTDSGAACAFVYDNDGLAIYATGTQGILTVPRSPSAAAVFEKKAAANPAGFSIIWSTGVGEGDSDIPIASVNDDGSLNLQVQTKNILKLHRYLRRSLDLELAPLLQIRRGVGEWLPVKIDPATHWTLSRASRNIRVLQLLFYGIRGDVPADECVQLAVDPTFEWKDGARKGQKRVIPTAIRVDDSYQHSHYPDIVRYSATFEVDLPPLPAGIPGAGQMKLDFKYPDLNGIEMKVAGAVNCSAE